MRTEFNVTPGLLKAVEKSLTCGFDRKMSNLYQGSCATGRLSAENNAIQDHAFAKTLFDARWRPGVYDLFLFEKADLGALYYVLRDCFPEDRNDLTDDETWTILDMKKAVELLYKASPLTRLAMCAKTETQNPAD